MAVLGTPLERVYPPEHHQLQTDVAEAGLLFTELAPESKVQRSSFALRNRLLVALARAVVVVECPQNSGALITARAALEQGRALWSMPADVLRPSGQGSNRLFLEGARPLLDPDQLLQTLGQAPLAELPSSAASSHPSGGASSEAIKSLAFCKSVGGIIIFKESASSFKYFRQFSNNNFIYYFSLLIS